MLCLLENCFVQSEKRTCMLWQDHQTIPQSFSNRNQSFYLCQSNTYMCGPSDACLTDIFSCWILGVVTFTLVLPHACKPCSLCSLALSPKDLFLASHKSKAYCRSRAHHSSSFWSLKSPLWWRNPPLKLYCWVPQHPRSSGTP